MKLTNKIFLTASLLLFLLNSEIIRSQTVTGSNDYPITPVPFTCVSLNDNFWAPRIHLNHDITVPHAINMCYSRIRNFKIAAGLETGHFQTTYPFDDSEVYKVIQGASYDLQYFDDPELDKLLDSLITIIGMAQEEDGYIYTIRTIDGDDSHPWIGSDRWVKVHDLSHELYNIGHLLEAASAHFTATGKTNFLEIAVKAADCVDNAFGWGKIEDYPGHQEIEKGLIELYRVTGEKRYLDLAKFFLDERDGGPEYCQAHKPVTEQNEAVGHSVRAVYMYAGMADVAAILNEPDYIRSIDNIWEDIVNKKLYITGGIGASGGNEGFDEPYNLPNSSAYCETCASIGNVYYNHRLFLLHGHAKYIDVLERTLYNAMLSGISVSGDRFFYPNVLESTGSQRSPWFECSCCPSNVTRIIPSIPGYIYAKKQDSIYINLFASNNARIPLGEDTIEITQATGYPWNGKIGITLGLEGNKSFTMLIRLPGWAGNEPVPGDLYEYKETISDYYTLKINGESYPAIQSKGYLVINREWTNGDSIDYELSLPVRKLFANENIIYDNQRMALQQGPLVYCTEFADNPDINILYQTYDSNMVVVSEYDESLFFGTNTLKTTINDNGSEKQITFLPYHLWSNRGSGPMQVWLSTRPERDLPDSLIIIQESLGDYATTNYVSSWEDLTGIYDLYDPLTSADKGPAAFGNWMSNGGTIGNWNWVQYNLHKKYWITASDVYWWDDNQGITLPDESYLSYFDYDENDYKIIPGTHSYMNKDEIKWDTYNSVTFTPVLTDRIRLNFLGNTKAQGILEWMIYQTFDPNVYIEPFENNQFYCRMYPNPVNDLLFIETSMEGNSFLEVYTLTGVKVLEQQFNKSLMIQKNILGSENCYMVNLVNNNQIVHHKIIFIE